MRFSESGAVLRARTRWVSIVSEAAPRRIQVEPERRAEPTRRVFRNVQHTVSSQAHEFGAVPLQEPAGALADSDGIREQPKAYGATFPLIAQASSVGFSSRSSMKSLLPSSRFVFFPFGLAVAN